MVWSHTVGRRPLGALVLVLSLGGCTLAPPDDGPARIDDLLAQRNVPTAAPQPLGVAPLSRELAIMYALHQGAQGREVRAALGSAAAGVLAAAQWQNPTLSLSLLFPDGDASRETGVGLAMNVSELLLRPSRQRLAAGDYEQALQRISLGLQALALDTERAWYQLVAAQQQQALQQVADDLAALRLTVAQRHRDAGNLTPLAWAQVQRDRSQSALALARNGQQLLRARLQLAALTGLPAQGNWTVPEWLPQPAGQLPAAAELSGAALVSRLDLLWFQQARVQQQEQLQQVQRFRWLGNLSLGAEHEWTEGGGRQYGPSVSWGIPLFHRNQAARARAAAELQRAEIALAARTEAAEREVLLASGLLDSQRTQLDQWQHTLLPALAAVTLARQQRVNFMLDGVFDLFDARAAELAGWQQWSTLLADYWDLQLELAAAVGQRLEVAQTAGVMPAPVAQARGEGSAGHSGHGSHGAHGGHGMAAGAAHAGHAEPGQAKAAASGAGRGVGDHAGHSNSDHAHRADHSDPSDRSDHSAHSNHSDHSDHSNHSGDSEHVSHPDHSAPLKSGGDPDQSSRSDSTGYPAAVISPGRSAEADGGQPTASIPGKAVDHHSGGGAPHPAGDASRSGDGVVADHAHHVAPAAPGQPGHSRPAAHHQGAH